MAGLSAAGCARLDLCRICCIRFRLSKKSDMYLLINILSISNLTVLDIVGQGQPWFCKYICPSGTLFAGVPLITLNPSLQASLGGLFALKIAILTVLIVASVIIYRPFCRYICPLGAVYGMFNGISVYRYNIDDKKCTKCGKCQRICKIDIPVYKSPNSPECIRCGECKKACPHNAIGLNFSKSRGEKKK